MLEIDSRARTKRELTNRIWTTRSIDRDWSILSPFEISDRFPASWTQGSRSVAHRTHQW